TRSDRQSEDRRAVLGCTASLAQRGDGLDRAEAIRVEAALDTGRVVDRQCALRDVVGPALAAEDQEALQPSAIVQHEAESACVVARLLGRRRLRLRSAATREMLQQSANHHPPPKSRAPMHALRTRAL